MHHNKCITMCVLYISSFRPTIAPSLESVASSSGSGFNAKRDGGVIAGAVIAVVIVLGCIYGLYRHFQNRVPDGSRNRGRGGKNRDGGRVRGLGGGGGDRRYFTTSTSSRHDKFSDSVGLFDDNDM